MPDCQLTSTHLDHYQSSAIPSVGIKNGRTAIRQQLALVMNHLRPPKFTMISDRGTFSIGHLLRLQEAKSHAICSVPWKDVKDLFASNRESMQWKQAGFLSIEQRRRRDEKSSLSLEHYQTERSEAPFPRQRIKTND